MSSTQSTILVTGGHITPAIATIEEIRERFDWKIVFVGRLRSIEGSRVASEEYELIHGKGIKFIPLTTGRIKRDRSVMTLWSLVKIPAGFVQALLIVWREKPTVILSFGGYIAVPIVFAAWCMRIPIVTHEQTTYPGLANRIIARLATHTCISFSDKTGMLGANTEVTGLPLRKRIFTSPSISPFSIKENLPLLFVTGGSTGSTSINAVIYAALPALLSSYTIIHQVGRLSNDEAQRVRTMLPKEFLSRYIPAPFLDDVSYSWVIHHADLVIGRSGANTVMELMALGKIALFIPLPWASGNEQYINASYMQSKGSAFVVEQKNFTPTRCIEIVDTMMKKKLSYRAAAARYQSSVSRSGAQKVVDVVARVVIQSHP